LLKHLANRSLTGQGLGRRPGLREILVRDLVCDGAGGTGR